MADIHEVLLLPSTDNDQPIRNSTVNPLQMLPPSVPTDNPLGQLLAWEPAFESLDLDLVFGVLEDCISSPLQVPGVISSQALHIQSALSPGLEEVCSHSAAPIHSDSRFVYFPSYSSLPDSHVTLRETNRLLASVEGTSRTRLIPNPRGALLHPVSRENKPTRRNFSRRSSHVVSESLRRQQMSKLFSTLGALLPQAIPKTDRCSVIDATVRHICSLEKSLEELAQRKAELIGTRRRRPEPHTSETTEIKVALAEPAVARNPSTLIHEHSFQPSAVAVSIVSHDAFVNITSCDGASVLFSRILVMLQEHKLEILNANLSKSEEMVLCSIHAKIPKTIKLYSQVLENRLYNLLASSQNR